ncbi:uncharacterized protein LOC120159019 [Hibiscus syriacus]|uniref:uncharacterized protein LOC120159019 n=1 Tax=Hibiscus syriacus TaxID=106335 RepID=UPI001924B556|nr:uncharacterized protein LOC120159019 [Hibiscus syriacus]
MERLTHMIQGAVGRGLWKPFRTSGLGPGISHLLFVDDMLFFAEATREQWEVIHDILLKFARAPGQKVNVEKTTIFFSKNISISIWNQISTDIGFCEVLELGKYLVVPLFHSLVTTTWYQYLIKMVTDRLSGWKMRTLSFTGRVTLAKSVLSALLIYTMQSAVLPRRINCCKLLKGLAIIWEDVRQFVSWCIGNGKEVDFWFDACLDDCGPLINYITLAGVVGMNRITIADMSDSDGGWHCSWFEQFLSLHILFE